MSPKQWDSNAEAQSVTTVMTHNPVNILPWNTSTKGGKIADRFSDLGPGSYDARIIAQFARSDPFTSGDTGRWCGQKDVDKKRREKNLQITISKGSEGHRHIRMAQRPHVKSVVSQICRILDAHRPFEVILAMRPFNLMYALTLIIRTTHLTQTTRSSRAYHDPIWDYGALKKMYMQ